MEGGGGVYEADGGGADLCEAVLEEIDLQIGLLLEPLQLLHGQLIHLDARGARHGCLLAAAAGEMGRGDGRRGGGGGLVGREVGSEEPSREGDQLARSATQSHD